MTVAAHDASLDDFCTTLRRYVKLTSPHYVNSGLNALGYPNASSVPPEQRASVIASLRPPSQFDFIENAMQSYGCLLPDAIGVVSQKQPFHRAVTKLGPIRAWYSRVRGTWTLDQRPATQIDIINAAQLIYDVPVSA